MTKARAACVALAVLLASAAANASYAQSAQNPSSALPTTSSLEQAIALALNGEPSVLLAKAQLQTSDANVAQARSASRGALQLQGQAAFGYNDYGSGYGSDHPLQISIGYERILWDNRATAAAFAAAQFGRAARLAQLDLARLTIRANVASAWIDVAIARGQIELAQANLVAVSRHERDATLQFNAGEVPTSVVAQATARRALAQSDLQQAQHGRTLGLIELQRLTGLTISQSELPNTYPEIPPTLSDALPQLASHPASLAARANRQAASANVQVAAGKFGPQVLGGLRANHIRDEFLPGYRRDGGEAYVRFQMPLWDGGARTARVAGARALQGEADAGILQTSRALESDLRKAYVARDTALAQIQAATLMVSAAQTARNSVEAEFRVGERPMVDLLDAQREQTQAQTMLLRARGNFILSHWWIAAALGQGASVGS